MLPRHRTTALLAALALTLPTGVAAAPYINDEIAGDEAAKRTAEASKRAQQAGLDACRERQLVYLNGFVERDGTISRWQVRESYAPPAATDSLLELVNRGDMPWSGAVCHHAGDPEWITVPITLNPSAQATRPAMTRTQINQLEQLLPGWLSRLRRSDPGLAFSQFRLVGSYPLNTPSGLFPMNEYFGQPATNRPVRLESTPGAAPESAFHPLKWEKGVLTRSPDGRFIFDMGADLEVMPDGELGGDCGGGWQLYDGPTHRYLWGTSPGLDAHATGGAWAGSDYLVLYGHSRFNHPGNPQLDSFVPAVWIFDFEAKTYAMWEGPPGPQWVFAGRPD